jgi:MFS family permease
MIIPLLPFYVKELGGDGIDLFGHHFGIGTISGFIIAAFTIAQLISAPVWGRLSDRVGRRPVVLIALGASGIAYLIFGFAHSLVVLFISRLVQGAGGGTVGVIQAYVADSTDPKDRARALGWLSATTNLGVALGPVLGSFAIALGKRDLMPGAGTLELGRAMPGIVAAGLCFLNMVFAARYLTESRDVEPQHLRENAGGDPPGASDVQIQAATSDAALGPSASQTETGEGRLDQPVDNPPEPVPAAGLEQGVADSKPEPPKDKPLTTLQAIWRVISHANEPSSRLILIYAISIGAYQGSFSVLALFLNARFEVTEQTIGYFFMYLGSISVFTRVLLLGRAVDKFGEATLSRLGLVLLATGIVGMPLSRNLGMLAVAVALIPLGTAFTFPCVTALLSKVINQSQRGLYMGMQQTYGGIARIIAPLFYGWAFDSIGVSSPYFFSSAIILATISLGFGLEQKPSPGPDIART